MVSNTKLRYSKQRETIYQVLKNDCSHPTVDTIYMNVKKLIPDISLGTVYRNLNLLAEQHRILRLDVDDDAVHFDGRSDPHFHFICEQCGSIYDLSLNEATVSLLIDEIQQHSHHKINSADILFHGTCDQCLKKK